MPYYIYHCKECGHTFEGVAAVKTRSKKQKCSCGGWAARDIEAEISQFGRVNEMMKDHPRKSYAMGVNPDQIPDFHKTWPWMRFDKDGNCLIRNRQEKVRVMKARGYDDE